MRYFISAAATDGPGWLTDYVDAEGFLAATLQLIGRAEGKFGARKFRITSVTEQPDIGALPVRFVALVRDEAMPGVARAALDRAALKRI